MNNFYTLAELETWTEPPDGIRLGVLGYPVAHSLSPPMQNAALRAAGLTMNYARFQILPNELARALRRCAELGLIGVNLTMPHKSGGFALVNACDPFAKQVGAINTIRFSEGKLRGANTDGPGFAAGLRESFGVELQDLRVLLLGAGGAGQAVAAQCAMAGCPALAFANRDFAKAQALAQRWASPEIVAVRWSEASLGKVLEGTELIVHATPLGSQPNDRSPLPAHLLRAHHLIYDLNYQPTALLVAAAAAAGARTASGLTMLLHQGALAFEFWLDRPAPTAAMRNALGL